MRSGSMTRRMSDVQLRWKQLGDTPADLLVDAVEAGNAQTYLEVSATHAESADDSADSSAEEDSASESESESDYDNIDDEGIPVLAAGFDMHHNGRKYVAKKHPSRSPP